MDDIPLTFAKDHLEGLLARAGRGEVVRFTDPSGSAFRVVPETQAPRPKRVIGQWKDKYGVPARLMEPLSDEELRWLTGDESP